MTSLQGTVRDSYGITVVDLSGKITLGEGSALLRTTVQELLSKGNTRIVLNLGDVSYIDSSGIGELISVFATTRSHGGEIKLIKLTKRIRDLLQITRLYTVFDIREDEKDAAAHFR
ncbi:MAG: STAS domain-containing protein [Candidatus Acidiferrales bacterium]